MKMKIITVSVAAALLGGCAVGGDYARYVDSQKEMQVAKSIAEAERYKAMAAIAMTGDGTTKVAAMFAMQNATANSNNNSTNVTPPRSPWDIARDWAALIVPAAVQGYSISANKDVSIATSNNSRDVAVSTNSTFSSMNSSGMTAISNVGAAGLNTAASISGMIQAPGAVTTTTTTNTTNSTNTLSGTGVLGSGTYSPTTNTTSATDSYNPTTTTTSTTDSYNPVTTTTTSNPVTTTNPTTNPPVCAIDGTGALVCI